jgi:hypothetical protein
VGKYSKRRAFDSEHAPATTDHLLLSTHIYGITTPCLVLKLPAFRNSHQLPIL